MAGNLISSLLSLANNLLPSITASAHAPSSSSNSKNSAKGHAVEEDLKRLMRTLERIKATLYDAEEREIRDRSVKLWLKEIKKVAYDAEDVLSEYRYEVTHLQVEARKASHTLSSHKGKQMEYIVPIIEGIVDRLNKIRIQFDEIVKDREALQLKEGDGVRHPNNKILRPPTSHMVDEASIFGRDAEITKVIDLLISQKEEKNDFSVISIVGKGGLGKTTIAQLVYKDGRISGCFDLFAWVCVSDEFDVGRLTKAIIESVSKINNGLSELSPLQEELAEIVNGKSMLLVLDDVWNENGTLWELFRVPFKEAKLVRILVTTRNKKVAQVMQATTYFSPTNLPEVWCWQLFQHYAFSGANCTMLPHMVKMGRDIMRKCGGLPLAVKSIASLLRHQTNEDGWKEIVESDLWEQEESKEAIFPALEISYAHLPAHLKPCFLFCSMYPKHYLLKKKKLIELWMSHGYIESKGKKKIREIGVEYYEELKERSFLDDISGRSSEWCKLHDIIHDLARLKSENEHYSVEINQPVGIQERNIMREAYHVYASSFMGYVNQILPLNQGLRTLSTDLRHYGDQAICNLTKLEALRVFELKGYSLTKIPDNFEMLKHLAYLSITSPFLKLLPSSIGLLYNLQTLVLDCSFLENLPESIGDLLNLQFLNIQSKNLRDLPKSLEMLNHLAYLSITSPRLKMLPSSIGLLYNLNTLVLNCFILEYLPESIGDLVNLQFLNIHSGNLWKLPKSLGSLSNLLRLVIGYNLMEYVPHGLVDFPAIKTMTARLRVKNIAWLKDITDLEGNLSIYGMSNSKDAQRANMRNKCKLETLNLSWENDFEVSYYPEESEVILCLKPEACEDELVNVDGAAFSWLESLQPHPNLKKLQLSFYSSATVPGWMSDPSSLQSIQKIWLNYCFNIESLPFRNLHTLKHLTIDTCDSIRVLQLEQLPSQLEELHIVSCAHLKLITGLGNLDMLATLGIYFCEILQSITMDGLHLVESTKPIGDSSHGEPHIGRQSISSLTRLEIQLCYLLCVLPNELIPLGHSCYVNVYGCGCPNIRSGIYNKSNQHSIR